jgi:hypothetical protein
MALKLDQAGVSGQISIVGGAAISLAYVFEREATSDIDALLPNDPRVSDVIAEIAATERLEGNWINDAVKGWVPFEIEAQWIELFREGNMIVRIATAELLLALKLRADRGRRDRSDIEALIKLCGISTMNEIDKIYESFHHQEVLDSETRQVFARMLNQ